MWACALPSAASKGAGARAAGLPTPERWVVCAPCSQQAGEAAWEAAAVDRQSGEATSRPPAAAAGPAASGSHWQAMAGQRAPAGLGPRSLGVHRYRVRTSSAVMMMVTFDG